MYEFQAGDKQGTCGEGREFLRLLGDGRLQYISRGDFGSTVGNLVRSDLAAKKLPVLTAMTEAQMGRPRCHTYWRIRAPPSRR